jgi:histidinol-phosphate aminotransferase
MYIFKAPATGITISRRRQKNPNNPTGTIFTRLEFDEFYQHVPERVLIILDEAYFEYAKDNPRYPDSMH